jgi:DNA topoisomerase IB
MFVPYLYYTLSKGVIDMPTLQEEKKIFSFQNKSLNAFKSLVKDLKSYGAQAKSEHKGNSKAIINKRKTHIIKNIKNLPQVIDFLDKWVGEEIVNDKAVSWRNSTLNLIRDYLAGQKNLREVSDSFEKNSIRSFKAIELHKRQTPLKNAIPVEFRAFLPDTITIDVDENGYIKSINDMFGNKTYTLAEKIKTQKKLISKYNHIVKKVKEDLKSDDEITKLSAIVTSIIMETGIRPGQIGNRVIETIDDKEIEVETFGAITLNPSHVNFVKDNFAELKFKGKKGTTNTATISNSDLTKVLKDYVDNALEIGSDYIFVTSEGKQYSYQHLLKYFKRNFKGFKITDFRKLRATQEVFDALREDRDDMLKKIKEVADDETEQLTKKVVKIITKTINKAHERAQLALSHDSSSTTEKSYINPEVLLRFISTSSVQRSLKDCVVSGKTKLHFDPMVFVREAKKTASAKRIITSGRTLESIETLIDMLEHIFEDGSIEDEI